MEAFKLTLSAAVFFFHLDHTWILLALFQRLSRFCGQHLTRWLRATHGLITKRSHCMYQIMKAEGASGHVGLNTGKPCGCKSVLEQ